ncbi:N-formylglutamate amidohydrolase [uncultured Cohaesibacter sp.]|uniref:N-formylglutamate amidohydrolase n=1 Tax=uncultured Cohaesibacter sp. TaxID=1002546 RepID=UPI002AA7C3C4|nr:N-formylglutamate amidohydrolase [uncultured Cohaesibacter sp.]
MAYPLQSLCDDKKRTESALNPDDFQPKDTLDIPFWIERPEQQLAPFIFSSPHSGRCYTAEFRNASRLSELELRSSEDSYVDLLYSKVSSCGVPFIAANFPRAYLDLNREPYELDPIVFKDPLPAYAKTSGTRVGSGLGTIARIVSERKEIYRHKLSLEEGLERIETLYKPYHQTLRRELALAHVNFGYACLIDCHSMPSRVFQNANPNNRPDIVLGDRYGASCHPMLVNSAKSILNHLGLRVDVNRPYAGGFITQHYGRPLKGLHALQIEIDRSLYMNEETFEPVPHFQELVNLFGRFAELLIQCASDALYPTAAAAE